MLEHIEYLVQHMIVTTHEVESCKVPILSPTQLFCVTGMVFLTELINLVLYPMVFYSSLLKPMFFNAVSRFLLGLDQPMSLGIAWGNNPSTYVIEFLHKLNVNF